MIIKKFSEFIALREEETSSEEKVSSEAPKEKSQESGDGESSEPKTKDVTIGTLESGDKVKGKMKVGHAVQLSSQDLSKIQNMRVTQYERDMYSFTNDASKEYKVSKDKEGKCTIFHNNQTLHKLVAVGVFMIPLATQKETEE
jgi:hypothetical protein